MQLKISADMSYYFGAPAEVLLLLEAANGGDQSVVEETLSLSTNPSITRMDDAETGERRLAFMANDTVQIQYQALVDLADRDTALAGALGHDLEHLPTEALRYLRPSRYCPSDRFERFVNREFGDTTGGDRVQAILDWTARHLDYVSGVSDVNTTALDTFVDRAGVCRDFTHLAISLCRASLIPARAVSAYGWRLDPPDMHAVLEVYVGDKWRLADPTGKVAPEGLVRVASGLDAADIAFMTIFGQAQVIVQSFSVEEAA